jgi:acetyltransferase-like isoleucine patch superfamily enzyme
MIRQAKNRLLSRIAFLCPGGFGLRPWLHRCRGVKIGKNVWISEYVYIDEDRPENVTIGENVSIGLRATIIAHFYWRQNEPEKKIGKVIIEKNAYIGPHCVILPNVTVGEGSVIMAGTVVSRNVPPHVMYGHPSPSPIARVTRPLVEGETYESFLRGLRNFENKSVS